MDEQVRALTRLADMDLMIVRFGRCNRCGEEDTVYESKGALLMVAHPTMRLGACVKCWSELVDFVIGLAES